MKSGPEDVRHVAGQDGGSQAPASVSLLRGGKGGAASVAPYDGPHRRTGIIWLRLLVGIAVLGVILARVDLGATTVRPSPRLLVAVAVATGLLLLSQSVAALRWKIVLGDPLLPWRYLARLYIIGSFFGLFLPTSVGGDAVRAAAAARTSQHAGRVMASVLIDRGLGVMAVLAYAALGLLVAPDVVTRSDGSAVRWHAPSLAGAVLAFAVAALGLLLLRRSAMVSALWHQGMTALRDLARSPSRLGEALVLAMICQGLMVLLWYALARGVHLPIPPLTFLWAVPAVTLAALLPVSFSGLGVREAIWLIVLSSSAIPRADIVAFSLLYFVCNILVGFTGGALFVTLGTTLEPPPGTSLRRRLLRRLLGKAVDPVSQR
jgi:uncharacterized membrane protein YbhN (UPF0104 family)